MVSSRASIGTHGARVRDMEATRGERELDLGQPLLLPRPYADWIPARLVYGNMLRTRRRAKFKGSCQGFPEMYTKSTGKR